MNIAHYVGKRFTGIITPDTPANRKLTIDFQAKQSAHYERKLQKCTFVEVKTGETPKEALQ